MGIEELARALKDALNEDGTFDVRSPDECSLDDQEEGEWQAVLRATNGLPAVNVARPSKWGNPYRVGQRYELAVRYDEIVGEQIAPGVWSVSVEGSTREGVPMKAFPSPLTAADVASKYRALLADRGLVTNDALAELRGRNLACWCAGNPCHADVLLDLANRPTCEEVA